MKKKIATDRKMAVFSCPGLGDGLVSLQLAYNLSLNGYAVELFHERQFNELQAWTEIPIKKYPKQPDIKKLFSTYEKVFISQDLDSAWVQALIREGKKTDPQKLVVLNPSPSKKLGSQAFYTDTYFRPNLSMVQNIEFFSKNILKLHMTTVQSPLSFPKNLLKTPIDESLPIEATKNKKTALKKIIIHPTASRIGKCWHKQKFLKLAKKLENKGFEVFFVMSQTERESWKIKNKTEKEKGKDQSIKIKTFSSLHELALFLSQGDIFLGGDSGVAHLAAALGLPTLSLFRSFRLAALWRPGWAVNKVIAPSNFIPNLSGFRLRDKKWASFITVRKVKKAILQLTR